jgi:hypothetical protein
MALGRRTQAKPEQLKPEYRGRLTARPKRLRKNSLWIQNARPQGLKPALIFWALRGAEAPLFHGTARIYEFFRNL